uniref:Uncharacterized protein n=1 Tax=Caenorhabditis japonica TaxID=281687 RepID=A0A8R1IAE7_CAEJA
MRELKITDLERIGETWSMLHNLLDRVWIHVIGSPDALFESIVVQLSFHSNASLYCVRNMSYDVSPFLFGGTPDFVDCL